MDRKDLMMDLERDYDIDGQLNVPARLDKKAEYYMNLNQEFFLQFLEFNFQAFFLFK